MFLNISILALNPCYLPFKSAMKKRPVPKIYGPKKANFLRWTTVMKAFLMGKVVKELKNVLKTGSFQKVGWTCVS